MPACLSYPVVCRGGPPFLGTRTERAFNFVPVCLLPYCSFSRVRPCVRAACCVRANRRAGKEDEEADGVLVLSVLFL